MSSLELFNLTPITPTDHERSEWRRFAAALRSTGDTFNAGWYEEMAKTDVLITDAYDCAMVDYRAWLINNTYPKGE